MKNAVRTAVFPITLTFLLVVPPAHAIEGRIGLHAVHLEPNGGAEGLSKESWGGGLEAIMRVPRVHHALGADFSLEFASLSSETVVFQESEFDFRRELTTSQDFARISLGFRLGPQGRGLFQPFVGVHGAIVNHSLTQTLTEPDDVNPENSMTQTKNRDDWGLGYDVTAGVNLNFWNRMSVYGGAKYLRSFGLDEPLGEAGATIDPEYLQAYFGVGMTLSWIKKLADKEDNRDSSWMGELPPPVSSATLVVATKVKLDPSFDIFNPGESLAEKGFGALFDSVVGPDYSEVVTAGSLISESGHKIEGVPIHLDDACNVILFAGITPGIYRLADVTVYYSLTTIEQDEYYDGDELARWNRDAPSGLLLEFRLPKSERLQFDLGSGETVYAGDLMLVADNEPPLSQVWRTMPVYVDGRWIDLEVDEDTLRPDGELQIENDPNKEIDAMEALVREFEDDPWSHRWRVRLQDLRAVAS